MHLGRNITHEYFQSQSVSVLSSFKCRSMMIVLKKTWRNSNSFKKETEKIVLLQVKDLIQIILKFRTEKYLCTFLSSNTILCTKYCVAGTRFGWCWKKITTYMLLHCGGACVYKKPKSQQIRNAKRNVCSTAKITFMCSFDFYNRYEHV